MFDDRNIDVNRNRKHFCDFVSRNYLRHYSLLWRTCSRAEFNCQPARAAGNNPRNLEIIVSDDRSPIPFPDTEGVSIVRRERNGGFGSAVNSGAARARGDWLIILNSDLELGEKLHQLNAHGAHRLSAGARQPPSSRSRRKTPVGSPQIPHRGAYCVGMVHTPGTLQTHTPVASRGRARYKCLHRREIPRNRLGHGRLHDGARTVYERVQGMDERFYMNSEEVDFQRRLAEIGVPRILVPQVTVTHEGGASSPSARRRQWLTTARFIYAEKWGFREEPAPRPNPHQLRQLRFQPDAVPAKPPSEPARDSEPRTRADPAGNTGTKTSRVTAPNLAFPHEGPQDREEPPKDTRDESPHDSAGFASVPRVLEGY